MNTTVPTTNVLSHLGNKEIKVVVRDRSKPAGQGVKVGTAILQSPHLSPKKKGQDSLDMPGDYESEK